MDINAHPLAHVHTEYCQVKSLRSVEVTVVPNTNSTLTRVCTLAMWQLSGCFSSIDSTLFDIYTYIWEVLVYVRVTCKSPLSITHFEYKHMKLLEYIGPHNLTPWTQLVITS